MSQIYDWKFQSQKIVTIAPFFVVSKRVQKWLCSKSFIQIKVQKYTFLLKGFEKGLDLGCFHEDYKWTRFEFLRMKKDYPKKFKVDKLLDMYVLT